MKKKYIIALTILALLTPFAFSKAATVLFPSGGGTGTSTIPANGYLLIGNGTKYQFIASSSLAGAGLSSSTIQALFSATAPIVYNSSTGAFSWINSNGYISTSTALTIANFSSANISQWTNNSGYITTSTYNANFGTAATHPATDFLSSTTVVNTPSTTIPTVYVSTFNGSSGAVNYAPSTTIPTNNNQLTNGSGFITTSTNNFGGVTGTGTTGNCTSWSASKVLTDSGSPCGSGGGGIASYNVTSANPFISVTTTTTSAALTFSSSSLGLGTAAYQASTAFLSSSTVVNTPSTTIPTVYVTEFNGSTGTYNLYVAGTGLTIATGTASTTITWTNPGYISTSTGLTTANFSSGNISQWTNNSGYLTSLTGALLAANNLSDLTNTSTARTNLGLGSIATHPSTDYLPSSTVYLANNTGNWAGTVQSKTLGTISTFASTDYLPSSTVVNAPSSTIYGAGYGLGTSGSNLVVSSTFASSSVSFGFPNATTTAPYSLQKLYTNAAKNLTSVSCDEYASATSTVELYYNLTNASSGIQQVVLSSIACGIAGTSTATFTTSTIPAGAYLFALVTGISGTPTQTTISLSATKK